MTQRITAVRANLLQACADLYADEIDTSGAPVKVTNGPPGANIPDYVVMVGKLVRQAISRPTLGVERTRERLAEISVTISTFVPGDEGAQDTANEAHDHLLDLLEDYFRVHGNETLGGSCREAWLSDIDGPNLDAPKNKQTGANTGRVCESVVTVTAYIRY